MFGLTSWIAEGLLGAGLLAWVSSLIHPAVRMALKIAFLVFFALPCLWLLAKYGWFGVFGQVLWDMLVNLLDLVSLPLRAVIGAA